MSMAAWRLTRDEKQRSAARVAALSLARSNDASSRSTPALRRRRKRRGAAPGSSPRRSRTVASSPRSAADIAAQPAARGSAASRAPVEPSLSHASGFLGADRNASATPAAARRRWRSPRSRCSRCCRAGCVWMMSGRAARRAVAVGRTRRSSSCRSVRTARTRSWRCPVWCAIRRRANPIEQAVRGGVPVRSHRARS